MAVALRNHDDEFDDQPMADMNVTPLVDVMLVLLIIFMVAAPLMVTGVPLDLPKTQAKQLNDQKPPLAVSIDGAGKLFLDTAEISPDALLDQLRNHAENELDRRIHVRADKNLPYRQVLEVMGQITAAGFAKVALVSELPTSANAAAGPKEGVPVNATGSTASTQASGATQTTTTGTAPQTAITAPATPK